MKYLVKDLARVTGLPPARIRKWQERYRILQPSTGDNGYHYYDNDDLFVLLNMQRRLREGYSPSRAAALGREALLARVAEEAFTEEEWSLLDAITKGHYTKLEEHFARGREGHSFRAWTRTVLQPMIVLVGRAWAGGVLSIAAEHAFTAWFTGYIHKTVEPMRKEDEPVWLVVSHPDDPHVIGAMLFYGMLVEHGVPCRFGGQLPVHELLRELSVYPYSRLSISLTVPRSEKSLKRLQESILARHPRIKIRFGGSGYVSPRSGRKSHTVHPANEESVPAATGEIAEEG